MHPSNVPVEVPEARVHWPGLQALRRPRWEEQLWSTSDGDGL